MHVKGQVVVGTTKGTRGSATTNATRTVPYPETLDGDIAAAIAGKAANALVWGDGQNHMPHATSERSWLHMAVKRAQVIDPAFPRITTHDLRHTAASLLVSSGANVKLVQKMLGHKSAVMTLDVYADLFDDDVAEVMGSFTAAHHRVMNPAQKQD